MFHQFEKYRNRMMGLQARTGVWQNPQGSFASAHMDILHGETQRLDSSLEMESARIEDLRAEKDEMFLEMSHKIASLQDNEKRLQEELAELKHSYSELNGKYHSDVSGLKQDVERYQQEARREKDANIERERENLKLVNNLRAEKEELFQKMARKIIILRNRDRQMFHELDRVHVSHEELKCRHRNDIMELQQQIETYQQKIRQDQMALLQRQKAEKLIWDINRSALQQLEKLQQQVKEERKAHLQTVEKAKASLDNLRSEYAILQNNATTEIKILQDRESSAQAELEKVNGLYLQLKCQYQTEVTAFKHDAEKYQLEISCVKNDLQRAKEDLLLLRAEEDGFQKKDITVSQEKEEDLQDQVDPVDVVSEKVSPEEKISGEPLSGCSTDPESSEETKITGETVLEDLDNPDVKIMQDGKKKKSKISFWKKLRKTLRWQKPKEK